MCFRKHLEDHNPFAFEYLQCDFKTKNNIFKKRQIKNKHTCHDKFACDECDFITNINRKLVTHKEKTHLNLSFTCDICGFVTTYGQSLRDHKRKTHSSVRYPCPDCEFKARRKSYLFAHVRTQHNRELDKSYKDTEISPKESLQDDPLVVRKILFSKPDLARRISNIW